jgi:hypothetical protein
LAVENALLRFYSNAGENNCTTFLKKEMLRHEFVLEIVFRFFE